MTKRDYIFLATSMRLARPPFPHTGLRAHVVRGWEQTVRVLARSMQTNNPKFDPQQFLRDAGVYNQEPPQS